MPKLLKATDPITPKTLTVLIYGQPGTGKTTLGLSAEAPLIFDFDGGMHRAGIRGNSIPIESWKDALDMLDFQNLDEELKDVLMFSKTIVIDTMGKLQDFQTDAIIKSDYKMANKQGGLSLAGYGGLNAGFKTFLSRLKMMGKDIIIICHEKEEKNGDTIILRPDIMGGSYGNVMKEIDLAGRLYIENGKRVLNFNPTDISVGKNCAEFSPITNPKLSDVIASTRQHIVDVNAKQAELMIEVGVYQAKIEKATKESINELVSEIKSLENDTVKLQIKAFLTKKAKELNLVFDKETQLFVEKPEVKTE